MEDKVSAAQVFQMLGGLQADTRHIITAQSQAKEDLQALRADVDTKLSTLEGRIGTVERFQIKALAIAGFIAPVVLAVISYFVPAVFTMWKG